MATIRLLCPFLLLLILVSCGTNQGGENEPEGIEIVEGTFESGAPKRVVRYLDEGEKRIMKAETLYYEDGQMERAGELTLDTLRQGPWKQWYPGGQLWSHYHYKGGLREGPCQVFYENGKLRYEGQWSNDQPSGHWKFYELSGALAKEMDYPPAGK